MVLEILIAAWDISMVCLAWLVRFGYGSFAATNLDKCKRPRKPLILYEYEGCPFCRKVREAICVLDLDVVIYPCPRTTFQKYHVVDGSRFRPDAVAKGGKAMFPLLIDENTDTIMYESSDIVNYLWKTYGSEARPPLNHYLAQSVLFQSWTQMLATVFRANHGLKARPSKKPKELLVLWGETASPFVKRVREVLTELELPHVFKTVPKFSSKREEFRKRFGHMIPGYRKNAGLIQIPLLEDPNTGKIMLESGDICKYLNEQYGIPAAA